MLKFFYLLTNNTKALQDVYLLKKSSIFKKKSLPFVVPFKFHQLAKYS